MSRSFKRIDGFAIHCFKSDQKFESFRRETKKAVAFFFVKKTWRGGKAYNYDPNLPEKKTRIESLERKVLVNIRKRMREGKEIV